VDEAPAVADLAMCLPNVDFVGLDMHIGSQVSSLEPYERGLSRLLDLVTRFQVTGAKDLRYLDIGGGLAVTYQSELEADLVAFGRMIAPLVEPTGLELIMEPGRFLVGNAGVLLTRVLYRKRSGGKEFVVTDAGMNDLLRPSHYNAFHRIDAVHASPRRTLVDVVGPVCESGDFFAVDRELDDVAPGDLIVIRSAGAYGYVMASNYNSRPRPAEVLVDGNRWRVIAARESYDDLVRLETLPTEWRTT
jgi:diaminopimelate decarboxylase